MENKILKTECLHREVTINYSDSQTIEFYKEMVNSFAKLGATHIKVGVVGHWYGEMELIDYTPHKTIL